MEIRVLRSFLAIAREGSMTRAAEQLHVTQPTLSKQMKSLERELGQRLFVRHSTSVDLTDEGVLLRERAADLVLMAERIEQEFSGLGDVTGGDIYLGLAESHQVSLIAREIKRLKQACPGLRYHITSGDTEQVTEKLDRGVLDFAALVEEPDDEKYEHLTFPGADVWGVVVRDDHELASRSAVTLDDLVGVPLFCSEQSWRRDIPLWAAERMPQLHLEGTFRLAYNGAVFVREGLGCLLTFDRLVGTGEGTSLVFLPLAPALTTTMHLIWRRHQVFSPMAERFLAQLRSSLTAAGQ